MAIPGKGGLHQWSASLGLEVINLGEVNPVAIPGKGVTTLSCTQK